MTIQSVICEAIAKKQVVQFFYDGSLRTCEPHACGINTQEHLAVLCWQRSGGSATGWRLFLASNISALAITGETFARAREGYDPHVRQIPQVLCRV